MDDEWIDHIKLNILSALALLCVWPAGGAVVSSNEILDG